MTPPNSELESSDEAEANFHVTLGPDDFQRLGVRRSETRLAVIRGAATRAAKTLASKLLADPNESTEQELSQVAVSTYRLLDPRQRGDRHAQVHIGRIRPGVLYQVSYTEFADHHGLLNRWRKGSPTPKRIDVKHPILGPAVKSSCEAEVIGLPVINTSKAIRFETGLRKCLRHPISLSVIIAALLVATGGVLIWGKAQQTARARAADQIRSAGD